MAIRRSAFVNTPISQDESGFPSVGQRQFTCTVDGYNKFWNVHWDTTKLGTNGCYKTVWGEIGTRGSVSPKKFDHEWQLEEWIAKKIKEKLNKGYVESNFRATNSYSTMEEMVKHYKKLCKES